MFTRKMTQEASGTSSVPTSVPMSALGLSSWTTRQMVLCLENAQPGDVVPIRNVDLAEVDMRAPSIRELLQKIGVHNVHASREEIIALDFTGSMISGKYFGEIDLSHAVMREVVALRTIFCGSVFKDVSFNRSVLDQADFRNAQLEHAEFYNASIMEANFSYAHLEETHGLKLHASAPEMLERLGCVASITGAYLPAHMKEMYHVLEEYIASEQRES